VNVSDCLASPFSHRLALHLCEDEKNADQRSTQGRIQPDGFPNCHQLTGAIREVLFIHLTEVLDRATEPIELQHHYHVRFCGQCLS